MSSFCPSSQNLRVAFSGKLKCLQHYTTSTSRFQHVSSTYQTHARYSQCNELTVPYGLIRSYSHIKLDMSLKMIEICENSERNNEWQIARNRFSLLIHTN